MVKFAICDDECFFREKLHTSLTEILKENKINADIDVFDNADDLLKSALKYDIYVLDIEMGATNGMQAAEKINQLSKRKPVIIFVTNYEDYVYQSFELEIFRFLRKDRVDILLERYIMAAIEKCKSMKPKYYVLKNRNEIINLLYSDIAYVKKDGKNVVFYMKNGKSYKERTSLNAVFDLFNDERFVFADRCYIINIANVVSVNDITVFMCDGTGLDMSRRKVTDVKQRISDYWGKRS